MVPIFGVNQIDFPALPSDAFNGYNDPSEGIPSSWPGPGVGSIPARVRYPIVSIRPDIPSFNAGTLDGQFTHYIQTMPDGATITLWREGDANRFHHAPSDIQAMHERAYRLVREANPEIVYAQVVEAYTARHGDLEQYVSPFPDWYGMDGYPEATTDTPDDVFGAAIEVLGYGRHMVITETNSVGADGTLPDNPQWYTDCFNFALSMNMKLFMVYGDQTVKLSSADLTALEGIRTKCQTLGLDKRYE